MFRESIMEDAEQIYHERGSAIADKSGYDVSSKTQWVPSEFLYHMMVNQLKYQVILIIYIQLNIKNCI